MFSAVATQGIAVVTGLQSKFDWAGVAAAGIGGGVGNIAGAKLGLTGKLGQYVSGMAGGVAGAAATSLVTGNDFGDTLMAQLPSIIGNTIGNAIGDAVAGRGGRAQAPSPGASEDAGTPVRSYGAGGVLGLAGVQIMGAIDLTDLPMYARAQQFGSDMESFLGSLPETAGDRAAAFAADIQSGLNTLGSVLIPPASAAQTPNARGVYQEADGTIVVTGRRQPIQTNNSSILSDGLTLSDAGRKLIQGSERFIPTVYHPRPNSGVTIGYGYDMKMRTMAQVRRDLVAVGVNQDDASQLALGASLYGKAADQFVDSNSGIKALTTKQGLDLFNRSVQHYVDLVKQNITVPLRQNQFDALVSLAFNAEIALSPRSSVVLAINSGNMQKGADSFLYYNKERINGNLQVSNGLVNRRTYERAYFLGK